jgi:hypothetical protein
MTRNCYCTRCAKTTVWTVTLDVDGNPERTCQVCKVKLPGDFVRIPISTRIGWGRDPS